jgi:mannose-6-phosphate isomerase-like protein (cupin superfamily)
VNVADPSRLVPRDPGAIPATAAVLKLWGDDHSGRVSDEIFVSNENIQQMRFTMPPGARFGHSESFRTNMRADEVYHVLGGTLVLANPDTGEVYVVATGEAVTFGRDTWHHGFSYGNVTLDVMQYFAPPPATGSSQPYAKTQPYLSDTKYVQDQWLGRWPEASDEAKEGHTMRVLRKHDVVWRLEGNENPILVGIWRSTAELTSGQVELRGGQRSDPRLHGGDLAGYVVEGRLNVFLPELDVPGPGNGWFQIDPGDGFFVPAGMSYWVHNMTGDAVRFLFGVAPTYLSAEAQSNGETETPPGS